MPRKPPDRPADLTIEILKDIRDAVRLTNARLDQTNARLDAVEHTLADMAGQFTFVARYVRHSVRQQGSRIARLEGRVEKLEQRIGRE